MTVFQFIFKMIRPFRGYLLSCVLVMLVFGIYVSLRPYLIKQVINAATIPDLDQSIRVLWHIAPLFFIVQFLVVTSWRFYDWCFLKYEPALKNYIAKTCFAYLLEHDHHYFQNHLVGALGSKMNDLMKCVPAILTTCISSYCTNFFCVVVAMCFLWHIHPWFSLLTGLSATIMIIFSICKIRYANYLSERVAEAASGVMGHIVDALTNMMNIRLFSARTRELNHLGTVQKIYLHTTRVRLWTMLKFYSIQGIGFSTYQIICLFLLIHLHAKGLVTAGDFAMIFTLNLGVVDNLWRMLSEMQVFSENWGSVHQALQTFFVPKGLQDKAEAKSLVVTSPKIEFKNVHFCYQGGPPLFQNKSIFIMPGEKVGLVGYSGGGKSTFINLILRLYEVSSGSIFIDDQNIQEVSQDSLRDAIALIPQDPILFHRTLMENIRYGRYQSSDQEVISAAKAAHAHSFIEQLPQGYHTSVGERGIRLSGGQRQRIAIARAILKNAPILILDEATSQLDSITENEIQASLRNLMQGKTTLVIAHRLSTLLDMDRILVFDQGSIVEMGTHQELIGKAGLYKTLLEAQVGGFLPLYQLRVLE